MTKHTPKPWYIDGHSVKVSKPEREFLGEGAPETICEMLSSVSPGETTANQVLIAAAPDLLEACKQSMSWLREYHTQMGDPMDEGVFGLADQLEAAIAKATVQA